VFINEAGVLQHINFTATTKQSSSSGSRNINSVIDEAAV